MENLKVLAPLDKAFTPIYRSLCAFAARAEKENGPMIRIALERDNGLVSVRDMRILPEGSDDALNIRMVERMVKAMLWVYGGFRVTIAGSKSVYEGIKAQYCKGGAREKASKAFAKTTHDKSLAEKLALIPAVPNMGRPVLNEDGSLTVHAVSYSDGEK